jgi:hypothetical protein
MSIPLPSEDFHAVCAMFCRPSEDRLSLAVCWATGSLLKAQFR